MIGVVLGLSVGLVMALTGAGGGILAVPLLMFGAGLSLAQAAPMGLLAVGLAAALGAALGLKAGAVRYKAAMLMAAAGILLAPAGVWLAGRLDQAWLGGLFALVLFWVAWRSLMQARRGGGAAAPDNPGAACMRSESSGRFIWSRRCAQALAITGAGAGMLSGLLGVGGGFVIVPALARNTNLDIGSIVPTSLAVIALVSVSGVASSALAGRISWTLALPFAGAAMAGMLGGRWLAARMAGPGLQIGFAAVSALVACGMLVKACA